MFRRPRSKPIVILSLLAFAILVFIIIRNEYQIRNAISYATRPLWDKPNVPNNVITHYYAEGLPVDSHTCQLHGWKERNRAGDVKVLDAVLMSSELDLFVFPHD